MSRVRRMFLFCFLALCCFSRDGMGQSFSTELTSPALWTTLPPPFSFNLGGRPSAELLPHWNSSERDVAASERLYTYTDPVSGLQVEADVRLYPDYPDVIDWVLHLRNTGAVDTPVLDDILPLRWKFAPTKASETVIRHAKGSDAQASDFEPLSELLNPGAFDHLESVFGLSSSRNTLPFFNLQNGNRGLIGAIGWSGDWKADFVYAGDGKTFSMSAGMKRTHLVLHPGEEIRTPRIVLMGWNGGTWLDAQNRWRRLLLRYYTPQNGSRPERGPVLFGSWGSEPIADKLAFIQWVHDHKLPLDLYGVDAGWYGESFGQERDLDNPKWKPWYTTRGDWVPSTFYYPKGFGPLSKVLKQDGFGFSLWVEPETAVPDRKFYLSHPDWFLTRDKEPASHRVEPGLDPRLLNLGNPAALASMTTALSDLVSDTGMTWYRQDFNIAPAPYWALADAPDRVGMTEIKHIEGLYTMWDDLLREHPGLRIDNCASGGRRIDLEMMSRSFVVWRTDYGVRETSAMQAQTTALAPWVPEVAAFESFTASKPWKKSGPFATPQNIYAMRSGYDAGFGVATPGQVDLNDDRWVSYLTSAIKEYRNLQPYFYGDFYPVLAYSTSDQSWTGWQWDRPEEHDGIALLMRRENSPFRSMSLENIHVDVKATYEVELRPGYEKQPSHVMKGSEFAALNIDIPSKPGSLLILYRVVKSTKP